MFCCTWKTINSIFHGVCLVATFSLVVYWMYMFSLNEDTSLVQYKRYYEDKEDVYPTLSLCFRNPFSDQKLGREGADLNRTAYFQFLNGDYITPKIKNIDYKSITLNISASIIRYWISYHDGSDQYYEATYRRLVNSFNGFLWDGHFYGCYRLQIPDDKNITYFSVELKNNVFTVERRPMHFDFFTLIHYPNQLLASLGSLKYSWVERLTNNSYSMRFKIDKVEVIRRRNRLSQPCHDDWKHYDEVVLAEHTQKIGCRAPYQEIGKGVRLCSTKSEMKQSRFFLRSDLNGMLQPCKTLQKVIYEYTETDLSTTNFGSQNSFWIGLILRDPYFMEITQTR